MHDYPLAYIHVRVCAPARVCEFVISIVHRAFLLINSLYLTN